MRILCNLLQLLVRYSCVPPYTPASLSDFLKINPLLEHKCNKHLNDRFFGKRNTILIYSQHFYSVQLRTAITSILERHNTGQVEETRLLSLYR